MSSFRLVLQNTRLGFYDRFAIFLSLLTAVASAILFSMRTASSSSHYAALVTLASAVATMVAFAFPHKPWKKELRFLITMIVAAITWTLAGFWWATILSVVLVFLYDRSRRPLAVTVDANGVQYPSFPVKHFSWAELSNVVLRDGILTIDFRNNHIIQQELDENMDAPNATDFNEFCRQQLQNGNVPA